MQQISIQNELNLVLNMKKSDSLEYSVIETTVWGPQTVPSKSSVQYYFEEIYVRCWLV